MGNKALYVVKVKDKDLYYNADEGMGDYICDVPLILDKEQAEAVIKYTDSIFDLDGTTEYLNSDLEVKQMQFTIN